MSAGNTLDRQVLYSMPPLAPSADHGKNSPKCDAGPRGQLTRINAFQLSECLAAFTGAKALIDQLPAREVRSARLLSRSIASVWSGFSLNAIYALDDSDAPSRLYSLELIRRATA